MNIDFMMIGLGARNKRTRAETSIGYYTQELNVLAGESTFSTIEHSVGEIWWGKKYLLYMIKHNHVVIET